MYFLPQGMDWPAGPPREFQSSTSKGAHGPDGKKGRIFSHTPNAWVAFVEKKQRWVRMPGGFYIGYWPGFIPEEFERHDKIGGKLVELGDGNYWEIPIANPMVDTCQLPRVSARNPDSGDWEWEVKEQYYELSQKALEVAGKFRETIETKELTFSGEDELRRLFCDVLALNYDLTAEEIEALRLLDQSTYIPVLKVFVDWDTMLTLIVAELEAANAPSNPTVATQGGNSTASGEQDI